LFSSFFGVSQDNRIGYFSDISEETDREAEEGQLTKYHEVWIVKAPCVEHPFVREVHRSGAYSVKQRT